MWFAKKPEISGFTFVHNALEGGYPIREAVNAVRPYVGEVVVADLESNDGTLAFLKKLDVRVVCGRWDNRGGITLAAGHAMNILCRNRMIVHFEADEVFDDDLIQNVATEIKGGNENIAVHRIQLEQNFQRCRWYPTPVHRVFPRGSVQKDGETTVQHNKAKKIHSQAMALPVEAGLLYDITNCFRDNFLGRIKNQAKLRRSPQQFLLTNFHINLPHLRDESEVTTELGKEYWLWKTTPFRLPKILQPLVGQTKYQ